MKKIYLFSSLLFLFEYSFCQTYQKALGALDQYANVVRPTSDNGKILGGNGYNPYRLLLIKYDASENVEWSKTYSGGRGNDAIQTADNGYCLAGSESQNAYIIKTDFSGNVQWAKTVNNSNSQYYSSVVQNTDGSFTVLGGIKYVPGFPGAWHLLISKFSTAGNLIWSEAIKTGKGKSYENPGRLLKTDDGGYILCGTQSNKDNYEDAFLMKIDKSGNVQWTKGIGGANNDAAYSMTNAADGGYVLYGNTASFGAAGRGNLYIIKTDASGNIQWTKVLGTADYEFSGNITKQSKHGFILSGATFPAAGGVAGLLFEIKDDGTLVWSKEIADASITDFNLNSLSVNSDNTICVVGRIRTSALSDRIYFSKYSSAGNNCFTTDYTLPVSSGGTAFSLKTTVQSIGTAADVSVDVKDAFSEMVLCTGAGFAGKNVFSAPAINKSSAKIYPDPVKDILTLKINSNFLSDALITISSADGKKLITSTFQICAGENVKKINVENLSGGIYYLNMITDKKIISLKFVKQ